MDDSSPHTFPWIVVVPTRTLALVLPLLLWGVLAPPGAAAQVGQLAASAQPVGGERVLIEGREAPLESLMVTRDNKGGATIRALRLKQPLRLDGRLDDEIYSRVSPAGDFIQQLPREGQPATEPTEVWVFFDSDNVYVAARCFDSRPERLIANELRRDNRNVFSLNDNLTVVFDTFLDRRNGFFFQTNPVGALRDQAITDGNQNESWNAVWNVKAARDERGYTVEMMIPFKSLRYRTGSDQVWGINVRRIVKWKNEVSNLTLVPASYTSAGVTQMSRAAALVGIEPPAPALNLDIKPYVLTTSTTDLTARLPVRNDVKPSVGFDAKYGLTKGLTADVTVNTDFAQVEEDLQQVNLTRFNLLFPEKRDFFLEGAGIFEFGGQANQNGSDVPILFFSRRIGLSGSRAVPVLGGGRVTGKAGPFDIGVLGVRTGESESANAPGTTFSAVRLRRDVLRRSSVGFVGTGRWPGQGGVDRNATFGADASFRFFTNVEAGGYWARSSSPGRHGDDASYRARFSYGGDRYGVNVDHLTVERNFNPELGFLRRADFSASTVGARVSPRLRRSRLVRRLNWNGELEYVTDGARSAFEDRTISGAFGVEFHSSDQISVSVATHREVLPSAFAIAPGVLLPAATYSSDTVSASYTLGQQRALSGTVTASRGSFYGGTRTTASYNGRMSVSARLAFEPTITLNWVDLPYGRFTTRLGGTRLVVSPTPRLGFSALTQFNAGTHALTISARMRWEYIPGSELFVVYSDGRDTARRGFPDVLNRSVAVKVTRLMRW